MKLQLNINRLISLGLTSLGLVLFSQPSFSAIYKCKDAQGNYSYTNLPCKNDSESTKLTIDKPKHIQKRVNKNRIKPNTPPLRPSAYDKKQRLKDLQEYKLSESDEIRKRRVIYERCLDNCVNNNKQCSNVCNTSHRTGNSFSSCSRNCSNQFKKCSSSCSF